MRLRQRSESKPGADTSTGSPGPTSPAGSGSDEGSGATHELSRRAARRARRAATRMATSAATTAAVSAGTHAAKRSRKVMRRTMRLVRFGILTSAIAGAVWWALQRRQDQQSTPLGRAAEPSGATGGDGDRPSGAGSRGSHPSEERGSRSDEIVDLSQAAKVLEVDESRIPVLVEGGLLEPLGGSGSGSSMRFRRSEVEAVRLQGG